MFSLDAVLGISAQLESLERCSIIDQLITGVNVYPVFGNCSKNPECTMISCNKEVNPTPLTVADYNLTFLCSSTSQVDLIFVASTTVGNSTTVVANETIRNMTTMVNSDLNLNLTLMQTDDKVTFEVS